MGIYVHDCLIMCIYIELHRGWEEVFLLVNRIENGAGEPISITDKVHILFVLIPFGKA